MACCGGRPLGSLDEAPAKDAGLFVLARSLEASPCVSMDILADLGGGCGEAICCCICCIAWRSESIVSSGSDGRPGRAGSALEGESLRGLSLKLMMMKR